jgi:CRP/FNR family transcriptional regulator
MSKLRHFKGLNSSDLKAIIDAGRIKKFPGNNPLFIEGTPCAGLFVLLSGEVHLYRYGPDGQENLLAVIEPVIMFNEVPVLDNGTNPVTAIPNRDSVIWHSTCESFQRLLQQYPQVALGLLPVLAARNRNLIEHYEDLSSRTVQARTAKLILALSDNGHSTINRGEHTISQMAARISTVPEALSRAISFFKDKDIIAASRTEIIVRKPEELAHQAKITLDIFS